MESSNKTIAPVFFDTVLKTFVAPIFPEPSFVIFFPVKILVIIKPKGIDQIK